jgi:D-alanyl-D-alanine carboxypeptidase
MRTIKFVAGLALLLGLLTASASAAPPRAADARLQLALDRLVATGAPGALVYYRDGEHTTTLASGSADLKSKGPIHPTDRFRIGSVTKGMTAVVVLQLAGERKLSLDDTVEHWLPGVLPNGRALTLRRLLNMSAGLYDYVNEDPRIANEMNTGSVRPRTPRQLIALMAGHKPHFAPGKGWSYCNTCYVLLGMIAEKASGHSIGSELRRRVFVPAGLHHTTFEATPRIAGPHAHGYERVGGKLVDVSVFEQSWAWTAGAVVSTTDDVARYYRALLGGKLLRADLVRSALTPFPVTFPFGPGVIQGYGFGIFELKTPCGTVWGHEGSTPGYRTWALNSKNGKRQVIVFASLGEDSLGKRGQDAINRVILTAYCGASWTKASPFTIPPPTGASSVGRVDVHLVDSARRRELMVHAWYPAAKPTGSVMPYLDAQVAAIFAKELRIPLPLLTGIRSHSHTGAAVAAGRHPVVLLSPGYGDPVAFYTLQAEELASHGYVVVGIDHTGEAPVVFPGGRLLGPGVGENAAYPRRMPDARFVLNRLAGWDARGPLAHRLDLSRIAMIGHSMGGAASAELMDADRRVKVGADLDGGIPASVAARNLGRPFLMLIGDGGLYHRDPSMPVFAKHQRGPLVVATFPRLAHSGFTDLLALSPQISRRFPAAAPQVLIGKADPARALARERTALVSFLDKYLRG